MAGRWGTDPPGGGWPVSGQTGGAVVDVVVEVGFGAGFGGAASVCAMVEHAVNTTEARLAAIATQASGRPARVR
jgi:hypothetical protein